MRSLSPLVFAALFMIGAMPADAGTTSEPLRVETVQGFFREYALGPLSSGPAIVAVGEDDAVWVALARSGQLARFSNESLQLFEIGSDSRPVGLALGSAGNGHPGAVWIAASYDNKILRFDVATQQTRAYPIPGDESWPFNIALGPDGSVWFTQRAAGKLGRLDPASGEVRHYELPTPNGGPAGLAVDPRSGVVWFTESYADRIGRFDPTTGKIEEIAMSGASSGQVSGPAGLALDARGGVWFAKLEGRIGHIPPGEKRIELIDAPPEALRTAGVAVAPDQDVWALALDGNLLLRYRPQTRTFTQYPIPTGQPDLKPATPPFAKTSRPFGIGIDREGNIWFSEQYMGQLGVLDAAPPRVEVVSPAGKVQTLRVPLTARVGDRVAGARRTEVRLDGEPVAAVQGYLDLSGRQPGSHRLEVRVEDAAGHATITATTFDYAPGHLALLEAIGRLQPSDAEGTEAREKWLAIVADLPKREARELLPALRADMAVRLTHFRQGQQAGLEPILDFLEGQGGRRVEVAILDQSPYFEPRAVTVRPGDTVLWRYDPPSDGHSLSRKLHRIEIQAGDGAVRSGLLRAGESFVHRFDATGTYTVTDPELAEAQAVVEVEAP
jgi:streptogramin lyase/plastocyanin